MRTEIANPLVARGIMDLLFDGLSLKIRQIKSRGDSVYVFIDRY